VLVKNLTPFPHAAKVTSRRPPRPEMTFVVKGTFALRAGPLEPLEDQPPLSADLYADGDDERAGEPLYPGDFADWKPNAEVMLRGTCHAPGGQPCAEATVRFAVGSWSKQLRVTGPRGWSDGLVSRASAPLPFTTMALSYANAFGGPSYAANPVGRGHEGREAPSIELVGEPLRRESRPVPASFAPLNPLWAPRAGKTGTKYGAAWRSERAPYYAEDFDWTFFQSAPADQQLEGHLRGDEEVVLQGLRPDVATLRCRLPRIRVRVFTKDVEGEFRELPVALDTLFVDADAATVTLVWRAVAPVREHDLADVRTVLVASEPLGDEVPVAEHRAALEAFEADPTGIRAALPRELVELEERQRKLEAGEPLPDEAEIAAMDPVSATMRRALGTYAGAEQAAVTAALERNGPLPARAAEELAKNPPGSPAPAPPTPIIKKPGRLPTLGLVHKVRAVMERAAELKKSLAGQEPRPEVLEAIAKLDAVPHDPQLPKLDPHYHPPGPLSTDAPGPYADLKERDLSGLDLRGADLRGADLEDALLVRTNLRGANLAGANLRRAVLYRADLGNANLEGADLTDANLASIEAEGASLKGAAVETAYFEGAKLVEANLEGAKGEYPNFTAADLSRARAAGATIVRGDFTGARLEGASFAGATLTSTTFEGAACARLDLTKARLDGARFPGASLVEARLVDARGHRSLWMGARLDRADAEGAWLTSSFFDDVSAVGARLARANLRQARLVRADLTRADLTEANLFEADLTRARVERTRFVRAHLYAASLHQAAGAGCDLTDAVLRRSTLEAPP
jgi:uncharacterized protein YjbI with pentapeptide repeats